MKFHPTVFLAIVLLALSAYVPAVSGQRTAPRPKTVRAQVTVRASDTALSPENQRRQDAFTKTWSTLNDNYFDKTFSGLDWSKIRAEYQPRVTAAKSDVELHKILEEMVNRLGKSHFAIIPPDYFETLEKVKTAARAREKQLRARRETAETGDGKETDDDPLFEDAAAKYGIGVDLRLIGDQFVITRVEKQSSAALAGLKPGFVIDKINGVSLTEMAQRIMFSYATVRNIRRYLPGQIVGWFLNGERDTSVQLTCLDGTNQAADYEVARLALAGETISLGSRFPEQFMQFQSESLSDDVGYVKFNVFAMPVIDKFCESLTRFGSKKAIVVDLRGNVGGIIGTLIGLSGMISDHTMVLGTSLYRVGSEPLMARSKNKNFKGKLIFLVDGQSASAAELFAASMQDNRRALIVGERTAGEALPAVSTTLATGAVLVYPIANFMTPGGRSLEGNGVEPNYTVKLDRKLLLAGVDAPLEKALSLIKDDTDFPALKGTGNGLSSSEGPPPPPPPMKLKAINTGGVVISTGSGSGSGPLPPPPVAAPPIKDEKALAVIADFAKAIGGADAFKKVATYEASGKGVIGHRGSETDVDFRAVRQAPDKFLLIMSSPAMGEVREIYNGKKSFLQSDTGLDQDLYPGMDLTRMQLFSSVFDVIDPTYLRSVTFEGAFDMDGRKMNVLSGKTEAGLPVGLAFDVGTKMLVRFSPPGMSYTLGDYRKVKEIMLPFQVDLGQFVKMSLETITLNEKVDPASFEKKEKCFDKAN